MPEIMMCYLEFQSHHEPREFKLLPMECGRKTSQEQGRVTDYYYGVTISTILYFLRGVDTQAQLRICTTNQADRH